MKKLKFIGLLLSLLIINSCSKKHEVENEIIVTGEEGGTPLYYGHNLFLRFHDATGNDLVKGIGIDKTLPNVTIGGVAAGSNVNSDLYTLYFEGIPNKVIPTYPMYFLSGEAFEWMYPNIAINGNYDYLRFRFISQYFEPFTEKIIFKLKCNYIFGDDATHEIITWWKPSAKTNGGTFCYRIEFEGKEFTEFSYDKFDCNSAATIVLSK